MELVLRFELISSLVARNLDDFYGYMKTLRWPPINNLFKYPINSKRYITRMWLLAYHCDLNYSHHHNGLHLKWNEMIDGIGEFHARGRHIHKWTPHTHTHTRTTLNHPQSEESSTIYVVLWCSKFSKKV